MPGTVGRRTPTEVPYPSSVKEAVPVVVPALFVVGLVDIRQRWGDDPDKRAENRHLANGGSFTT